MPSDHPPSPLSAIPSLPGLNALTLVRALFRRRRRTPGARTPRSVFVLHALDGDWLRRYRQALGFRDQGVPLTYYYLLAQRAQVATMLDPGFPFRLPGMVHAENALRLDAVPDPALPLVLSTTVSIRPPGDSGAVYATLDTVGEQDGRAVLNCRSTYLVVPGQRSGHGNRSGNGSGSGNLSGGKHARARDGALPHVAGWQLARGSGRAYARVSGDWNPIHLWRWSARLMGMRRPIIHGMHTLARTCAALEDASGRAVVALDARFKAPATLGSELALGADLEAGLFAVRCGERTVAEGRFALGAALDPA